MTKVRLDAGRMLALNVATDALKRYVDDNAIIIDGEIIETSNRRDTHRSITLSGRYQIKGQDELVHFEFATAMGNRQSGYGWLMAFARLNLYDCGKNKMPKVFQCALPR